MGISILFLWELQQHISKTVVPFFLFCWPHVQESHVYFGLAQQMLTSGAIWKTPATKISRCEASLWWLIDLTSWGDFMWGQIQPKRGGHWRIQGGTRDGVQFLSFSCSFYQNFRQTRMHSSGGSRIFPRGGREPSRGGVNTPNFPENCMKSKEFGRPGGGVCPSRPP